MIKVMSNSLPLKPQRYAAATPMIGWMTVFTIEVTLARVIFPLSAEKEKPAPRLCPSCKSEIAEDATRCPHCTSQL